MEIQEVKTLPEFRDLRQEWNDLFHKAGAHSPFLTWEWAWNWWEHLKTEKELNIVLVREGRELIALAPLMRERKPLGSRITFIGSGLSDYLGFLTSRDGQQAIRLIFRYLMDSGVGKIELADIPESAPAFPVLRETIDNIWALKTITVSCESPFLKIETSWDDFWGRINSSVKKDIKWSGNRLNRNFGGLKVRVIEDYDEKMVDALIAISTKAQAAKVGRGLFRDEKTTAFIKVALKAFSQNGQSRIYLLEAGSRVISYIIIFCLGGKYYYWTTAFDPEFAKFSPGKLLTRYALEDAFKLGLAEFDFMKGKEPYKLFWTKTAKKNYVISLYRSRFWFFYDSLIMKLYGFLKKAKKLPWLNDVWIKASKLVK
jgi:CelD/BcsL family acetyltransferase involved in cellulose biosynthesis